MIWHIIVSLPFRYLHHFTPHIIPSSLQSFNPHTITSLHTPYHYSASKDSCTHIATLPREFPSSSMHIHTKSLMNNQVTDIGEADERDGIRFTFNTWPGTRMEATKCVIPMGCL